MNEPATSPNSNRPRRPEVASDETKVLSPKVGLAMFVAIVVAFFGTIAGVKALFKIDPPDPLNGFTVSDPTVDLAEIERAIPLGKLRPLIDLDSIPAERAPELRHRFVVPSDRVAVVTVNGETRGYLLRVLVFHEIANDTLGGLPIAVVHHPVSDLVTAFERTIDGDVLLFGTSGLLLDSHLVAYDLPPEDDIARIAESSLWSPLIGVSIGGPRSGTALRRIPCEVTTWGDFRTRFPDATIPLPPARYLKEYRKDPYTNYVGTGRPRYAADPLPDENERSLFTPTLVVATHHPASVEAYPIPELIAAANGPALERLQSGVALEFRVVDREKQVVTVTASKEGELSWVAQTYWFTWFASEARIRAQVTRDAD